MRTNKKQSHIKPKQNHSLFKQIELSANRTNIKEKSQSLKCQKSQRLQSVIEKGHVNTFVCSHIIAMQTDIKAVEQENGS